MSNLVKSGKQKGSILDHQMNEAYLNHCFYINLQIVIIKYFFTAFLKLINLRCHDYVTVSNSNKWLETILVIFTEYNEIIALFALLIRLLEKQFSRLLHGMVKTEKGT